MAVVDVSSGIINRQVYCTVLYCTVLGMRDIKVPAE